jgi:hypothetical protein
MLFLWLRHLQVFLYQPDDLHITALEEVERWYREGCLKTLAVHHRELDHDQGYRDVENQGAIWTYINAFKAVGASGGCLEKVPRMLIQNDRNDSASDPDKTIQYAAEDLHKAFGGQLWGAGKLLWKDHIRVRDFMKYERMDSVLYLPADTDVEPRMIHFLRCGGRQMAFDTQRVQYRMWADEQRSGCRPMAKRVTVTNVPSVCCSIEEFRWR